MKVVSTTAALVALAVSFSFADGHRIMYMDIDVRTDGGSWQEVDGRLAQTDASAWLASAIVPADIQGKAEYSFDVAYIGGLEDDAIGFSAIVPGFAIGLNWDPTNLGGSGLRAQVYNADGAIHEHAGIKYDFDVPASKIGGIMTEIARNTPLTVRIRTDFTNGNVWVNDPFDQINWWALTVDPSVEERHNMIGVATRSVAASFGNLRVDTDPVFDSTFERFSLPFDILSLDSNAIGQIAAMRDQFVTFDNHVKAIAANKDAVSTLKDIGIDLSDLQSASDALSTILADASDHHADTLDSVAEAVDSLNSVFAANFGAALYPITKQIGNLIGVVVYVIRSAVSTRRVLVHTVTQDDEPVRRLFVYRVKTESDFSQAVRFAERSTPTSEERIDIETWYFWACDSQEKRVSSRDRIEITPQRGVQEIYVVVGNPRGECREREPEP